MIKTYFCESCNECYVAALEYNVILTDDNMRIDSDVVTSYKCSKCGEYAVEIDSEILMVIKTLNTIGLKTAFCCEGHRGKNSVSNAYIRFSHEIDLDNIIQSHGVPIGWKYSVNKCYEYDGSLLTYWDIYVDSNPDEILSMTEIDYKEYKRTYLDNLESWVVTLLMKKEKENEKPV